MKKFLVIGNPIEHSLSPTLHNYWIKNNGIDAIYEKQKLNESELEQIIEDIKKEKINAIISDRSKKENAHWHVDHEKHCEESDLPFFAW